MAIIKGLFIFEQYGRGWTESYWWESSQTDLDFQAAQFNLLATARKNLLGREARMKALRVSVEGVTGDSKLEFVNLAGLPTVDAGPVDDTLLVTIRAEFGSRRKQMFMRGIYDDLALIGGAFARNEPNFANYWPTYVQAYRTGRYGWVGLDPANTVRRFVAGYTTNPVGTVLVTANADIWAAPLIGTRQVVRMSGINGGSPLNGQQVVTVTGTDRFTTVFPFSVFPYRFGGRITYAPKRFFEGTTLTPQRITSHKTGTPLLESRGRQPARARG